MSQQGKFYAHTAVDKDLVVCESPQRVEDGGSAAPGAPAPAAPTAAAHTHSGYSKWERFDADANRRLDRREFEKLVAEVWKFHEAKRKGAGSGGGGGA